ncbi:TonB-dependent receptor domain-containing protein [Undibacterium parvum]|uniref:TonB-dependent receptor n=1 Tax=Undibacterium parvum TaxID=401471 RepID=A0A3S9HI45_9BURK|nr:TonB-dependent receptor [Undibacterium parvum]AZP11783.1 TonB-dependent receptor [Undibacterium parvum]
MRLQEKIGVRSVRLALGVLAGSLFIAGQAMAQEQVQRVEITGSSIKRIAVEGALPVQRVSAEAIARSGATSVSELMQSLPAMQGFTITATAAGSNSGGNVGASIHDIGTAYTLVLLNGRRMAPQGSGSAVNLNAIPLSAIERIEILTDGAGALYGSDAIAGVINFIMKKNQQGGTAEAVFNAPQASGGGKFWNVNASYGFGNLDENGYNVLASFRHDEQTQMKATDREFAKTAYVPFSKNGTNYVYDRTSTATVPANVAVTFTGGLPAIGFSPYLKKNGSCPERNFISLNNTATTQNCAFDFASTVEIVPEAKRDSLFTKGSLKVGSDTKLFADVAISRYDLTARIAPNTAPFTILKGSAYYNDNVLPWLTPAQAANTKTMSGNYRTYDWGTRDSNTITDSTHLVLSGETNLAGWDLKSGLTLSKNAINESYVGGYALATEFKSMLANRSFDPFAPIGKQSAETMALIKGSLFNGSIRTASTTLKGFDIGGSRELFDLPGGKAGIGIGADYREYHYEQTPSAAALAGLIYNFNASPAYDMTRSNQGFYSELVAPVTKDLELTASARFDSFTAIKNAIANRDMGEKQSAGTYKLSMRYQPTQAVLLRGSYGTGFKAPTMLEIGQPLVNNGFTASAYECPIASADYCRPGKSQYNQIAGGNENLKPETSKQYTIGFRIEPIQNFSFGLDLWDVQMRNQVSQVSEKQAFADPVKFRDLFTTYTEPATGNTYWAFKSLSVNIGKSHNRGIDWDMTGRQKFDFGTLTGNLAGTYLIKSDYTAPGTDNVWENSMDKYGINDAVSFSNLFKFTGSLETGALTNTLTVSYRNGYQDAETSVRNLSTNLNETLRLDVPSYTTVDWQGIYNLNKAVTIRAGVKNIFNVAPPLSLRASSGHQVGFDPRYADPTLRSFYMAGSYKF